METEMTFKRYQELAEGTINTDLTENKKLAHALYGLSSETGEISGIFQKELQGHEVRRDDLEGEIGDLLWFAAELCTVFGFDMGEIAQKNINKLKKRYPDGFDEDRSVNRDLYPNRQAKKCDSCDHKCEYCTCPDDDPCWRCKRYSNYKKKE